MYRKLFKLSAREMANEPVDQFFTNLYIYTQIKNKQRIEIEHGSNS